MCFIYDLLRLLRLHLIRPIIKLWREVVRLTRLYPCFLIMSLFASYLCILMYFMLLNAHVFIQALLLIGFVLFAMPLAIVIHDWCVRKYRTHWAESQDVQAAFNVNPDPGAPLIPEEQLRSVISIAPPTAIWSTEPLRQQPVLDRSQVRDNIYRKISPTHCPQARKRTSGSSKKRERREKSDSVQSNLTIPPFSRRTERRNTRPDYQQPGTSKENPCVIINVSEDDDNSPVHASESREEPDSRKSFTNTPLLRQTTHSNIRPDYQQPGTSRQNPCVIINVPENEDNSPVDASESKKKPDSRESFTNTPILHQTTHSNIRPDYQQPGTSRQNPCVVIYVPEIDNSTTDATESRESVEETGYNRNLLSPEVYIKRAVKSSGEAKHKTTARPLDSSCKTPERQSSKKGYKDSKHCRINKRHGRSSNASTTKGSAIEAEKALKRKKQPQQQTFSHKEESTCESLRKRVESASQLEISNLDNNSSDERSSPRASDSGTAETTLSEKSGSPGSSRHSSPGDGKRDPNFEGSPKVHVSRKSSKNS